VIVGGFWAYESVQKVPSYLFINVSHVIHDPVK
jgi:hypothetical protein